MSGASILLIEDDLNVYHGIQRKLRAFDYEVLYAPDAVASISQARQHHPDLILLDLGLPAGDGFVVIERLKQFPELSVIPIVVLSGRDRSANEMRAMRAGAAGYVMKRDATEKVLEAIRRCLQKRERREARATYSVGPTSEKLAASEMAVDEMEIPVYGR